MTIVMLIAQKYRLPSGFDSFCCVFRYLQDGFRFGRSRGEQIMESMLVRIKKKDAAKSSALRKTGSESQRKFSDHDAWNPGIPA